ncbi:MAG: DegV family protein, partial [Anaerolineae bacterium]
NIAERVRTRRAALSRMLDMMDAQVGRQAVNLAVVHAADLPSAQELMERAQARFDCRRTYIAPLAASLVTNLGIGTLGIVAYLAGR